MFFILPVNSYADVSNINVYSDGTKYPYWFGVGFTESNSACGATADEAEVGYRVNGSLVSTDNYPLFDGTGGSYFIDTFDGNIWVGDYPYSDSFGSVGDEVSISVRYKSATVLCDEQYLVQDSEILVAPEFTFTRTPSDSLVQLEDLVDYEIAVDDESLLAPLLGYQIRLGQDSYCSSMSDNTDFPLTLSGDYTLDPVAPYNSATYWLEIASSTAPLGDDGCSNFETLRYSSGDFWDIETPPVSGCTDLDALNYNELATVEDNSCFYFESQLLQMNYDVPTAYAHAFYIFLGSLFMFTYLFRPKTKS